MTEAAVPTPQPTPAPSGPVPQTPSSTPTPSPTPTPEPSPEPKPDGEPKSLLNQEAPAGAPEAYADFAVPEGYEIDPAVVAEAAPLFKEMGLTQAQAQKLVDVYSKHSAATSEGLSEMVRQQNEAWQSEAKAHPDLRGKLDPGGPVLTTISRALDSLGDAKLSSEFKAAMDFTGAGNHPAFIRTFYALAKRLTEGAHVGGNGPSPLGQRAPGSGPPSAAKALYPNLPG